MERHEKNRRFFRLGAAAALAAGFAASAVPLAPALAQSRMNVNPEDMMPALQHHPSWYYGGSNYGWASPYARQWGFSSYGYAYGPYVYPY